MNEKRNIHLEVREYLTDRGLVVIHKDDLEDLKRAKDQAYSERNKVVAALAHCLHQTPADFSLFDISIGVGQHQGDEWKSDWRTVLVIDIDGIGQITWHFHDSEKYLLKGLPVLENYQYDGHTAEQKYQRLFDFVGIEQLIAEASE